MTTGRVKLKPCPFCGGEAEIERYGTHKVSTVYSCGCCGCSLETGEEWSHGTRWNTRATLTDSDLLEASVRAAVSEGAAEGRGAWRSCSGCHELNEGHPTGRYSEVFKSHLGLGCQECGGIGAVWDYTDYTDMGDFMAEEGRRDQLLEDMAKALEETQELLASLLHFPNEMTPEVEEQVRSNRALITRYRTLGNQARDGS